MQSPILAKAVLRLLVVGALHMYRAGWKESPAACSDEPVVLETIAEEQRERGGAEDRSVKLALKQIH